jgi:4-diphosphocytidyl-2-C-methyl-D-erythritol kinase
VSEAPLARCPAKINLSLRVVRRRPDGYHELDTVFQAIDLWDTLTVEPGDELSLACDAPGVPTDGTNLVLRAAGLLRERHGVRRGARFRLRKSIPCRAGLGGGSSDGAGALLLSARLWDLTPPRELLEELARELGADVPFFLTGGTARGWGRGDRIEALPALGERIVLLGIPPFGLSTAEVFSRFRTRLTLPSNGVSVPVPPAHKWPEGNDFGSASNDLEQVVFEGWPELEQFRNALLEEGASGARLSGSGSTVYGILGDRARAGEALSRLAARFSSWTLIPTRTIERAAEVVRAE